MVNGRSAALVELIAKSGWSGQRLNLKLPCVLALAALLWLVPDSPARAQTGLPSPLGAPRPSVGGTWGLGRPNQLPLISGSQDMAAQVHLDPVGKPCLTVYGYAKQQVINPNIYEHTIYASSNCARPIKLRVCYYHSQQCAPMVVPGYERRETILGIMPQMKEFRFEYWEQFGNTPPGLAGTGYRIN